MRQPRRAGPSPSASRSFPRTRRRLWMPTSPRTWKQPSRAIENRSNHPHEIDPRFQRSDQSRAPGAECPTTAHGHLRTAGNSDIAISVGHADRVGPRRGTCRHSAAKGERHQFIHELLTVSSRRCHDIRDDQWNEEHGSPTLSALNRYVRTLHEKRMRTSSVVANNYGGH
jgi:hypothetical protein